MAEEIASIKCELAEVNLIGRTVIKRLVNERPAIQETLGNEINHCRLDLYRSETKIMASP